ncbi:MAG: polysaccharide biosynthesis C-terminal domain-containing protein [Planctomycetota bacterium]|jgi:dTDP-4-dehydrorhamnose 3,5-epimerase
MSQAMQPMNGVEMKPSPVPFTVSSPAVLRPLAPQERPPEWGHVHAEAVERAEPIFVPVSAYADDRGWSLMNLMAGGLCADGQINFSMQNPGVVKAWHRHAWQTDFWCCVTGMLKVGVYREDDATAWMIVTGERRPGVVVIPPGLWHGGATVGAAPAGLLYHVTKMYDPSNPDEERRSHDSVPGFPWAVQHG